MSAREALHDSLHVDALRRIGALVRECPAPRPAQQERRA